MGDDGKVYRWQEVKGHLEVDSGFFETMDPNKPD